MIVADVYLLNEIGDKSAEFSEGLLRVLQNERHLFIIVNELSFEIGDCDADALAPYLSADKVSGRRIQTIYARSSSSGRALLAHVDKKAFVDKLSYQFRDGRNACVQLLAEISQAIVAVIDA